MSQKADTFQRILIARTDRIGDLVLTLPLAVELKKKYPDSHITFLVRLYTAEIARNCQSIDEVMIAPEVNGAIQSTALTNQIKAGGFNLAFLVFPDKSVSWACFRAGVPIRIGTAFRWYSFLFNKKVYDHRKDVRYHELEYNLRLMHAIGEHSVVNTANVEYNFRIPEAVVVDLPFPLDVQGLQSPVIVIHPGSGGSAVDLPVEKFAALTGLLAGHGKYTLIVTGNTAEQELCKTVCGTTNAINLAGKLNLLQLMVIIQKSNIFVSNSTGPLHIAAAMGKYAIGFFPKIKTCSPERWAPYTEKRAVFVPELGCSNCTREQCARLECMNSIDIQKVVEKIEKFSLSVDSGADNV